jgi:hypothetical protein
VTTFECQKTSLKTDAAPAAAVGVLQKRAPFLQNTVTYMKEELEKQVFMFRTQPSCWLS